MIHTLTGVEYNDHCTVILDGLVLDSADSQKVHNHSPDGFSWGYAGSGPSQLALAIMLKLTGKSDGYQNFKFNVIAKLPFGKDFKITFTDEQLKGDYYG